MRIGTLSIRAWVEPGRIYWLDRILETVNPLLDSLGIVTKSKYIHTDGVRALLFFDVQIETYYRIDRIYTALITFLNEQFWYYRLSITLNTEEKGG